MNWLKLSIVCDRRTNVSSNHRWWGTSVTSRTEERRDRYSSASSLSLSLSLPLLCPFYLRPPPIFLSRSFYPSTGCQKYPLLLLSQPSLITLCYYDTSIPLCFPMFTVNSSTTSLLPPMNFVIRCLRFDRQSLHLANIFFRIS